MLEQPLKFFVVFFVVVEPVSLIPVFSALTQGATKSYKHRMAVKAVTVAAVILAVVEAVVLKALEKRPEMRAFEHSDSSLKEQRSATRSTGLPRLDAFGNGYVANPNQRIFPPREEWKATWDVGVQLSWSPNDTGTTDAAMRSIDAKRRKLDADRAAVKDALRDEIRAALVASKEAVVAAETASRGLTAAEESYRVRRELFELGRATDVEWIDAETDVLRARLEMIQARVDARVAHVQLVHAVGRDVLPR